MIKSKTLLKIFKILGVVILLLIITLLLLYNTTTDVTENLDSYEYNLPFKPGDGYRVSQGYGGLFTHRHIAAIDFDMPVGTPIYASREGTVYSYKDNSDDGGILPKNIRKANYIIIRHDDGSFACYWHLQKNGVVIKRGRVSKGQHIAFSGATGQVLRPHLHFSVKNAFNYEMNSFRRTKFKTTIGVIQLKQGRAYERPID